MKNEIFTKGLHHEYSSFESIYRNVPRLVDCNTDTIYLFLDSLIGDADIKESLQNLEKINTLISSLEKLLNRVKLANEKLRIQFKEDQKDELKRLRQNEKQFTTTTAGIYIAEKLNRKSPFSRAQMNNFINGGKLRTEMVGVKNIIYQGDLDQFIEKFKDTLRLR